MCSSAVALQGWYGHGNIGDELMLRRLVFLCREKAGREPVAIVNRPGSISLCQARRKPRLRLTQYVRASGIAGAAAWLRNLGERTRSTASALKDIDTYLIGGGTQMGTTAQHLACAVDYMGDLRRHGLCLIAYGIGLAQSDTPGVRRLTQRMAELFHLIAARDARTYALLLGAASPNVFLAADPLYALLPDARRLGYESASRAGDACAAVLCPRVGGTDARSPAYREAVVDSMAQLARAATDMGHRVRLMPLWHEDDPQLCWLISDRAGVNCEVSETPCSLERFCALTGDAVFVASMPLHGTLLATLAGRVTIPISYHVKCEQAAAELGLTPVMVRVGAGGAFTVDEAVAAASIAPVWYGEMRPDVDRRAEEAWMRVSVAEETLVSALAGDC